jgi:flagellar basal-body rod protein FlgF
MSEEAIYVAASGALVQEARLEVLSNNLANINTIGFKEDRAVFSNYLPGEQNGTTGSENDLLASAESETLLPYRLSNTQVKLDGTRTSFEQGQIRQTGNQLDFAISGNGFFCVETLEGDQRYTRKGNFTRNEEGSLVTQDGLTVLNKNGRAITLDGNNISVDAEGNISEDGVHRDTLNIVDFDDPYSLVKSGDTSFAPADATVRGRDAEDFQVVQSGIELSNVNPIKVMTEMIEVHRAFESYQKIIKSMDETVSGSLNEIGK